MDDVPQQGGLNRLDEQMQQDVQMQQYELKLSDVQMQQYELKLSDALMPQDAQMQLDAQLE